jgi:hypothetical protein
VGCLLAVRFAVAEPTPSPTEEKSATPVMIAGTANPFPAGKVPENPISASKEKPAAAKNWRLVSSLGLTDEYSQTYLPRTGNTHQPREDTRYIFRPSLHFNWKEDGRSFTAKGAVSGRVYDNLQELDSTSYSGDVSWKDRSHERWGYKVHSSPVYLRDTGGEENDTVIRPTTYFQETTTAGFDILLDTNWKVLGEFKSTALDYSDSHQRDWRTLEKGVGLERSFNDESNIKLGYRNKFINPEGVDPERSQRITASYQIRRNKHFLLDFEVGALIFKKAGMVDPAGTIRLTFRGQTLGGHASWNRDSMVNNANSDVVRRDVFSLVPTWRIADKWLWIGNVSVIIDKSIEPGRIRTTTSRSGFTLRRTFSSQLHSDLRYVYLDQNAGGTSGISLSGATVGLSVTYTLSAPG